MRKTSYDGADSSSITSGIDNETKKSAVNFNKMKKSSIKRKVQHFSHDSDDGIEPLLQTDKEKVEIANRSAKYLINKSKTESLHEKDSKVTDGYDDKCSIPIHVSSTSNMITNNVKESSTSTSYICGVAPIHNHMNTNIFSVYNESIGSMTTKNPILVEIDTSKPGTYSPSPLIFTTAKIHSDSKIKLMEPVQVTSVPILSTIEGNIVKAGVVSNTETKAINLSKTSEGMKILSGKPEMNVLPTCKEKTFSPTVPHCFSNAKNEPCTTNSFDSANLQYKKDEPCQYLDSTNKPKLGNNDTSTWQAQPITEVHTSQNNILIPHKIKQSTEILQSACTSQTISEKCSSTDKSIERLCDIKDNKISQAPKDLKNQDNHKINLKSPDEQQSHSISKDNQIIMNASGTKKLLRQKNALTETTNESTNKILKSGTQTYVKEPEKNTITKLDNEAMPKIDHKNNSVAHGTIPIDTKISFTSTSATGQPRGISVTTVALTEIKPVPSTVSVSTSKVKSITETLNLNPTLTGLSKNVPKPLSKFSNETSQTNVQGGKETINSKLTAIGTNVKPDILSSSSSSSQPVKTDPLIKCPVTTDTSTLPSYIVSTSKTKIGLTLTSGTPAITTKPQTQKTLVSVNTTNAHVKSFATSVAKSPPSTSATNGTKQTSFSKETKSKSDTIKKGGRA